MKILIIYTFYSQRDLMHTFASKLGENGLFVDLLCIENYSYECNTTIKWPYYLKFCFNYINRSRSKYISDIIQRITYKYLIIVLLKKYDIVDFHAYYPSYNRLMNYCKKKNRKFDITFWGSDLMRADIERKKILKFGLDNCYRIKLSKNLHDVLVESYGNIYDEKCRIVGFGSIEMPHIDSLSDREAKEIINKLYGKIGDKKILVCGYNGSSAQNHSEMIEALSRLTDEELSSIHVVIPMTYGASPEYLIEIFDLLNMERIFSYTILDSYLESKEIAAIRKTADIVLNIQDTDAFAGSLKGHLYCENVCILGEWLNYSVCDENGIFYLKTSKEELTTTLKDVIYNYSKYHSMCKGNHDRMKALVSWDATIMKQVSVYGE